MLFSVFSEYCAFTFTYPTARLNAPVRRVRRCSGHVLLPSLYLALQVGLQCCGRNGRCVQWLVFDFFWIQILVAVVDPYAVYFYVGKTYGVHDFGLHTNFDWALACAVGLLNWFLWWKWNLNYLFLVSHNLNIFSRHASISACCIRSRLFWREVLEISGSFRTSLI